AFKQLYIKAVHIGYVTPGFVVHIPEDMQRHAPECGETTALLSLIKDEGLLSGLDKYLAPHLEEGSAGKKALDMFGLFNV
ncbi:hypothetical protein ABLN24_005314, partial [Escherichia coli]